MSDERFCLADPRSGKEVRVGIVTYPSREAAQEALEGFRDRQARGGRSDLSAEAVTSWHVVSAREAPWPV